ncbi:MAG: hypothetical protein WBR18_07495 [Anaerolineales bacterium]
MSNQMFHNGQGLHNYNASRYQDLRREADQERLARQAPGGEDPLTDITLRSMAPVGIALILVIGAAITLV